MLLTHKNKTKQENTQITHIHCRLYVPVEKSNALLDLRRLQLVFLITVTAFAFTTTQQFVSRYLQS